MRCDTRLGIDIYTRTLNGQIRWDISTLNRVDLFFFSLCTDLMADQMMVRGTLTA